MTGFLTFSRRVLLLCVPQLLVSFAAIHAYATALIYPPSAIGFHVALIATLHLVFFSAWGLLARRGPGSGKWGFRAAFALSLLLKGMAFNLVYLASYSSYRLWSAYISWDNLRAISPHLEGFHLALGAAFPIGLGLAALLLLGYFLLALKLSPRLLQWLGSTYAGPDAVAHSLMLTTLLGLLAIAQWLLLPHGEKAREMDPILAFWSNQAGDKPRLTPEMLADRAAGLAYQPPQEFRRRNVIIICIDCLRADHLSFNGYPRETTPFLASWAGQGGFQKVAFAVSNGNDSPQGIRAILGSRYPHRQNMHNFKLQDALKRAGYRTHVIATGDHTTLGGMRQHYGLNLDVFSDGLATRAYSVNDDRSLLEALDRIEPADGQPAFFYFHLMSAHVFGVKEPAFGRWQPALLQIDWNAMILGNYDPQLMTNTYDNGVLQADHHVRRIIETLKAKGYLEDYIGVVTGDHGEGLGERGNYGHTRFLFAEDLTVPILFFESQPVDYGPLPFASHVDIAPTLLDRLGLPAPDRWDGKSLYQTSAPTLTFAVGAHESGWRAILRRQDGEIYKYLCYGNKLKAFRERLFNVTRDAREQSDLSTDPASAGLLLELRALAAKEFNRPVPPLD